MKIFIEQLQNIFCNNLNLSNEYYYKLILNTEEEYYLFRYTGPPMIKKIAKRKIKYDIKRSVYCCKIKGSQYSKIVQTIDISKKELIELLNIKLNLIHDLENTGTTRSDLIVIKISKENINYLLKY